MADSKISALPAATDLTGAVIPIVQGGVNKKADATLVAQPSVAQTWTAKQTFNLFEAAAGTLTDSTPVEFKQTWNNAAVTFTAINADVTSTASNGSSLLLALKENGTVRFSVQKTGAVVVGGGMTVIGQITTYNTIQAGARFSVANQFFLESDGSNSPAFRNGVNPQSFRLYNTYTNGTNFERAKCAWESNRFVIATEAETGTKRGITLEASDLVLSDLPTSDPTIAGRLWLDGTALKVSAG
jgi:hypothetical protein